MVSSKVPSRSFWHQVSIAVFPLAAFILANSISVEGQAKSASVSGQVSDQSGAAISGASARLWQQSTGFDRIAKTDNSGLFLFRDVLGGKYNLSVSSSGFSALTREIVVSAGRTDSADFVLHPAALAEEMVVSVNRIAETPEVLEQIPGSVDVIDKKMLETSRAFTFTEALRKVDRKSVV